LILKFSQRVLRKNHRQSLPYEMIFLDVETTKVVELIREKHRMDIAWTCYVRRRSGGRLDNSSWEFWDSTFRLCRYIEEKARDGQVLWLFGHNVFFDLQVSDFFFYFTKWGWILDFVYEDGMSYILVIHKGKKRIKVISTTNYFATSLKEVGKMLGLEKNEVDFDTVTPEELKTYCKRDVEIIRLAMEKYFEFITVNDLGRFSMTRASQAFNAYRHRFMKKKIYIHDEKSVIELERSSYIGGRVECFEIGEVKGGPFLTLDVNSMFPHIMKNTPLPVRLIDYQKDVSPVLLIPYLKKFACIAEVELETDKPLYAVRSLDKIIFPVGRFRAFLCSPLLQEALRRDHLKAVHRMAVYEEDYIFDEYVDYFYSLRTRYKEEGNAIFEAIVKILLNSLYGKFAQWAPETRETEEITCDGYWRMDSYDLVTKEKGVEYKLFNKIVTQFGKKPAPNTLIAISSHITEWARYILWTIMEGIGLDRVIYCDTDSVKIRKSDFERVKYPIDNHTLGSLKVESETERLQIISPKCYLTEKGRTLKGIPQTAKEVSPNLFEYLSFPKQDTHMREKAMRFHIVEKMLKGIKPEYDKGIVDSQGKVSPFTLSEF